jgi:hypothetical protein
MKIPKPSARYIEVQKEYARLQGRAGNVDIIMKKRLEREMEAEFMKAWKLFPDIRRRVAKLRGALFPNNTQSASRLDHCTYYFSVDHLSPAIVTQPYFECADELAQALRLGLWSIPEVIHAPEWGFYYPGKAQLHIIFFPRGYARALAGLKRSLRS